MKYAIIEHGGKQYRAVEGESLDVDLMTEAPGKKVTLDSVLLFADGEDIEIGTPILKNTKVKAEVVKHGKGPKIVVFKYRPRQRYRVKSGHRQKYTQLLIEAIERKKK